MSDPNDQPLPPIPPEPPRFLLAPYRTPFQRACDRLAVQQALYEMEAARAAEGEDPQYGWHLFAWRCGRADMPRGLFPF